jgi:hypothetical protein
MSRGARGQTGKERDIEAIVSGAMGDSVTPARLLDSNTEGFLRRLLRMLGVGSGEQSVEGPFTEYLNTDEQLHYLFHSTGTLTIPRSENPNVETDDAIIDTSIISPSVALVTDTRTVYVYGHGDREQVLSIPHEDVLSVDYRDLKLNKGMKIRTAQWRGDFTMWSTDPFAGELSDAAAYVHSKSGSEGEYRAYDFDSEGFDAAREALGIQLGHIEEITEDIDTRRLLDLAVTGAKVGAKRGQYTAGVGFLLGAGYGIWAELSESDGSDVSEENIDPETTAEMMLRWQRAGESHGKGVELASGALGAAIAIDEQTSGRHVSRALAELDVEWMSRQLEAGNAPEAGLQVASQMIEPYSEAVASLLDDDFFTELAREEGE